MNPRCCQLLICLFAFVFGSALHADDDAAKKNDDKNALKAYKAARIIPVDGRAVSPGTLVVRGDRVEAVLADGEDLPEGAEVVDLGNCVIMPGFVNPLSAISERNYVSSSSGRASIGARSPQDGRKSVGLSAVDPEHKVYRRIGRTGYTTIAVLPGDNSGLIIGHASVIRPMRGGETSNKELVLSEKAYLMLGFAKGGSWHSAAVKMFKGAVDKILKEREAKKKAAEEAKKKAAEAKKKKAAEAKKKAEEAKKNPQPKPTPRPVPPKPSTSSRTVPARSTAPKKPPTPDPLQLLFEGKLPAFLRVASLADLDHLLVFLDSLPLKFEFVLVTGSQPPEFIDKIVARKSQIRGIVLEPTVGSLWETSIFVNTAREFVERGFEVAFVPTRDDLNGFRSVPYDLARMVKTGLREKEVIRGVTSIPAKLLGLSKDVGSLHKGAFANFQVLDGDPLTGAARLLAVYVEGEKVFADDPKTNELSGEAVR